MGGPFVLVLVSRSVRAVLSHLNQVTCPSHPSSGASRPPSSSKNMLERVVPSALAILSAVPMVTFLSPRSTELT